MNILNKKWALLNFDKRGDQKGYLVAIEENKDIPFNIKRIFYIFDTEKGVVRGKHANKNSRFVLTCGKGSCKVKIDTGKETVNIILDHPQKSLYLNKMVWKEMYDFSEDCGLIVISDSFYDPEEYVYDYNEWKKLSYLENI